MSVYVHSYGLWMTQMKPAFSLFSYYFLLFGNLFLLDMVSLTIIKENMQDVDLPYFFDGVSPGYSMSNASAMTFSFYYRNPVASLLS